MTQPNTILLPIEPSSFRNIISETVAEVLARLPKNDDSREQYLFTEQDAAKRLSMSYDKLKELRLAGKFTPSARGPYRYTWQRITEIGDWLGRQDEQPDGIA